jgi:hypothetical protein
MACLRPNAQVAAPPVDNWIMTIVGLVCILAWAWLLFAGWQRYPAEQRQLQALRTSRTPDPRHPAARAALAARGRPSASAGR